LQYFFDLNGLFPQAFAQIFNHN